MNRRRLLPFLLAAAIFWPIKTFDAFADDIQAISLPTIIVTAPKRYDSSLDRVAEDVGVMTREDIARLPVSNLGEALAFMPGVDVKTTDHFGQPTSVSMRGAQSRQVLVMIDGIPFNTQLSGQANPARIAIDNVERIEVIRGASSSAWGTSLGGVINVVTKGVGTSVVPHGRLESSFAEFSSSRNSLELNGAAGKLGYYVSGSYFATDGSRPEADAHDNKVFGKIAYPIDEDMLLTGSFGYNGGDTGDFYVDQFLGRVRDDRETFARYGQVRFDYNRPRMNWNAAVKYNNQFLDTRMEFVDFLFDSVTRSQDVFYGFSLNGSYELREDDVLALGGDLNWNILKTTSSLPSSKTLRTQAPYANYTYRLNQLDIIPGLRWDHNDRFGSQTSPSFGLIYHFENDLKTIWRAKASRAFSAPPLLWVYQTSSTTRPNPDLQAEKGYVYESGIETSLTSNLAMDINVFYSQIKDAITSVTVSGKSQKVNAERFDHQGVEAMWKYNLSEQWMVFGGGGFTDVRDHASHEIVRDQGIARTSYQMGLDYVNQAGYGMHLTGYYKRWTSSPDLEPNDRKIVWDVKVVKKFKATKYLSEWETFLSVHNLTNSKYWSSSTFPLPERYFEGGFALGF